MGSFIVTNKNLAFVCDLALMGSVAGIVYNYLFVKTKYNILYVLLIGTVLTTFFTSIQSSCDGSLNLRPMCHLFVSKWLKKSYLAIDFS